jgi:hypothetical protein
LTPVLLTIPKQSLYNLDDSGSLFNVIVLKMKGNLMSTQDTTSKGVVGYSGLSRITRGGAIIVAPRIAGLLLAVAVLAGCLPQRLPGGRQERGQIETAGQGPRHVSLFDGKTLGQWKITEFGGQGNVYIKDGSIFLEMGNDMTGVTWTGPVVRMNYEIGLEAMRVMGSDFFCGLTFPVEENPCSLILGGWGGSVCGLSNIDYYDAANNETTRVVNFESGRWYRVRLRVTPDKIEAWLDDEQLVDTVIKGRHISIRPEVDLCQPLGISTWRTTGVVRNISLTKLTAGKQ